MKRQCIVVLGMHRSGTSALTGALHLLGLHAGKNLLEGNEFNSKGYFECAEVVKAHDRLLQQLGSSWQDVRPLAAGWQQTPAALRAKAELRDIFREEFGDAKLCVIKDPRMCRLLPLWLDIFQELDVTPSFLISSRSPADVIASLGHRDAMHSNQAALLYLRHILDAELQTRQHSRLIVAFSSLLQDWESAIRRAETALNVCLPTVSADTVARIGAFLNPDLRHFDSPTTASVPDPALALAHQLYQLLDSQQAHTADLYDSLRVAFDRHLGSLEPWLGIAARSQLAERELIQPGAYTEAVTSKGAESTLYWASEATPAFEEQHALVTPFHFGEDRQAIRFVFTPAMTKLTALRLDLTNRPAYGQIHAARLHDAAGDAVWTWDGKAPLLTAPSPEMHVLPSTAGDLSFFSSGFDPYATLQIPDHLIQRAGPSWSLILDTTVRLALHGLQGVANSLELAMSNLHTAKEELSECQLGLKREKLAATECSKDLADLNHKTRQYAEELIRAESQLELLKELLLLEGTMQNI